MFGGKRLRGRRIAVLAADGFEDVELRAPVAAFRAAGAHVTIVSLHGGRIRGMNLTEPAGTVKVHERLSDVTAADFDALFVPGGFVNPDLLRQSREARAFVQAFDVAGKPIASLCHGPWLLASAELLPGRRVTSWPGVRDDLVHAGAVWVDEAVVRDGNWVTSRGPQDLPAFVPAAIELFDRNASLALGRNVMTSDPSAVVGPSDPRADHPPEWALAGARSLPRPSPAKWLVRGALLAVAFLGWRVARVATT